MSGWDNNSSWNGGGGGVAIGAGHSGWNDSGSGKDEGWDNSGPAATGDFPPDTEENNISKHANGDFEGGKVDQACRNCGREGHFARECAEPRKMTGECYNCGQVGHNKAECPNEKVQRPFTGTCRICSEEGHPASQCPQKPPDKCRNCGQEGHKASECTDARAIDLSKFPDMSVDEAWSLIEKASKEKDLDDFKDAVKIYSKVDRDMTYEEMEKKLRAANIDLYLIAMQAEIPISMTSVNLQGKGGCKYIINYSMTSKARRNKQREAWPATPEENLERLKDTGEALEQVIPVCHRCNELGHTARGCPQEHVEAPGQPSVVCVNCGEEGHRMRDCKQARQAPASSGACRNCGQEGHRAAECMEPRSSKDVECRRCGEMGHFGKDCPSNEGGGSADVECRRCHQMGHFAKDCPNNEGGGGRACRNCGEEGHIAKECDKPRNPETITCRNCDKTGHMSRECPEPKDWSRVKCSNCGEMGHTYVRCKKPAAEENDGGDQGVGVGGATFGDTPGFGGQDTDNNTGVVMGGWDKGEAAAAPGW